MRSLRRWNPARFGERAPRRGAGAGFSPGAALLGGGVVVAIILAFLWSAVAGSATPASHPHLFGGSIVLDDNRPLVVLDVATGAVNVRLSDVFAQVDSPTYADVSAVPLANGTLLLNRVSGTFNMLGKDNFVLKRIGGGVGLGPLAGATGATGVADGASAYIVRHAPHATVSLVGADTVAAAARAGAAAKANSPANPPTGATTAARQAGGPVTIKPRGFATLAGSVPNRPGGEVAAGGDLFALVDRGKQTSVVQLNPDTASAHGLATEDRGVIGNPDEPAALEGAPAPRGMSSATPAEVALASPGLVRIYFPGSRGASHLSVAVPGTEGATTILPVSGTQGSAWFLAQTPAAWLLFGVDPDGHLSGPQLLAGLPARATLAPPALSVGHIYTMARTSRAGRDAQPALWVIDTSTGAVTTVAGQARYPRESPAERASFASARVVSDGLRVIFDNPDSLLGVVVFTDGSHRPTTFDKATALTVSATGPLAVASAPPKGSGKTNASSPGHSTSTTVPAVVPPAIAPQVSPLVSCADPTQTPRAPQITSAAPSARAVLVVWSYPLLDQQDCEPDSWAVQVQAIHGPQPAQPIQVESGQLQYSFVGLRPNDTYQVTVTAYIGAHSTPSAPVSFTTSATGPDPPTSVTTSSDGNGNWDVSWTPCAAAGCYVPADTWIVTGASCGSGFVGTSPSVQVNGTQTSVVIPAADLLGAFMSFDVQGVTASGLLGDPTSDHSCTESWQPPDPSHIAVKASAIAAGATVTATVEVSTDEAPTQAYGSAATEFTYQVGGVTVGPTSAPTAIIPGLAPGTSYQPAVTVSPRGHPQAAVTVTGAPFTQTLPWPAGLALQAAATVDPGNPNSGTLTASFPGAPHVPLAAAGRITCGSVGTPVGGDLDPSGQLSVPLDLTQLGGSCTLTLALTETSTKEYGVPSPALSAGFSVGTQVDQSSFSVGYVFPGLLQMSAVVNGQTMGEGVNWVIAVTGPPACSGVSQTTAGAPQMPVTLDVSSCDNPFLPQPVTVNVSYTYLGSQISFAFTDANTPPPQTTTTTRKPKGTTTTSSTTTTTTTTSSTTTTAQPTSTTSNTTTTTRLAAGQASPPTVLAAASMPLPGASDQGGASVVLDVIMAAGALALAAIGLGGVSRRRRRNDNQ